MNKSYFSCLALLAVSVTTPAIAKTVKIDIPEIGDFVFLGNGNAAVNYGGVTFSQNATLSNGNFFNVSTGFSGNPAVLSSQQQTSGVPNILITLPELASGISLPFGSFLGNVATFSLSNGLNSIKSSLPSGYATNQSFSINFVNPFNSILVTGGSNDVLSIGSFTYETLAPSVPETATWGMMILGFVGMGAAMRYRRKASKVTFA